VLTKQVAGICVDDDLIDDVHREERIYDPAEQWLAAKGPKVLPRDPFRMRFHWYESDDLMHSQPQLAF